MAGLLSTSSSPHLRDRDSVPRIMWSVAAALVPACAYSVYIYGWYSAALIGICVATAALTEAACQTVRHQRISLDDGSAVVMGMLVACNIPPVIAWWIPIIGTIAGMAIGKHCFGGLGCNIFNPALIARAFLLAAYPKDMTTWKIVGAAAQVDATTTATPLMMLKEHGMDYLVQHFGDKATLYKGLFIGNIGGCIGETSAVLLLVGGIFLLVRGIISWYIPVTYLATLALATIICGGDPLVAILAGGVMLGAWFMATDMVTSPFTPRGQLVFGVGCGLLTFLIRKFGGYPEGVSYAILIMNTAVPWIDRVFPRRVFGTHLPKSRP